MPRILLISEYTTNQSPVGTLNVDFMNFFSNGTKTPVSTFSSPSKYYPGGFHPVRLLNLLWLTLFVPFVLLFYKIRSELTREPLVVVVTTSPPNLHLIVVFFCRLFFITSLVWFQDAHPEAEARLLEARGLRRVAKFLRWGESKILPLAQSIICLDKAMKDELVNRVGPLEKCFIVPPWATYLRPAKAMHKVEVETELKLIYAGNYGYAHDLNPFAKTLGQLSANLQRRISLTFIGMSAQSQLRLSQLFENLSVQLFFRERLKSADELKQIFGSFHYGIVSLSFSQHGIACPSKAYTYLSQGLPVLYIGPENTLSSELVETGWGQYPTLQFLESSFSGQELSCHRGQVFPDPRSRSLQEFEKIIQQL